MNDGMYQGRLGQIHSQTQKDPTVASAHDAVTALKKRANEIRGHLAQVDGWKAELATIERMLVAAESK